MIDVVATSRRARLGVAIVGALAIAGFAIWYVAIRERMPSVRMLVWHDADGTVLEPGPNATHVCSGDDTGFDTLQHASAVWVTCRRGSTWLGRLELARGEAHLRWRFPDDLPLGKVIAVAGGPNGELGVVYAIHPRKRPARIAIAVAGPAGWLTPPKLVVEAAFPDVLGVGWTGNAFGVVVYTATDEDDSLVHSTYSLSASSLTGLRGVLELVTADGTHTPYLMAGDLCAAGMHCNLVLARVQQGRWEVVVTRPFDREGGVVGVGRDGVPVSLAQLDSNMFDLDAAANLPGGEVGALGNHELRTDGVHKTPRDLAATGPNAVTYRSDQIAHHYETTSRGLVRHWHYVAHAYIDGYPWAADARYLGDRFVELIETDNVLIATTLDARTLDPKTRGPQTKLARVSLPCTSMERAAWIPRTTGGYWLVTPEGCYLGVDELFEF